MREKCYVILMKVTSACALTVTVIEYCIYQDGYVICCFSIKDEKVCFKTQYASVSRGRQTDICYIWLNCKATDEINKHTVARQSARLLFLHRRFDQMWDCIQVSKRTPDEGIKGSVSAEEGKNHKVSTLSFSIYKKNKYGSTAAKEFAAFK